MRRGASWVRAGLGAAAWLAAACAARGGGEGGGEFLGDFSGRGTVAAYANRGDAVQEARYVTEGAMALDFALVSRGEAWALRSRFEMTANMGKSISQELPFSPMEMAYEIAPYVERRGETHAARLGWSHVCQHLIYKEYEDPWYLVEGTNVAADVYWNRIFIGAGRKEIRPERMREAYFGGGDRAAAPRFVWGAEAGAYLRSLLGLDGEALYGQNDWRADAGVELRWVVFRGAWWYVAAASLTRALLDGEADVFWRQSFRLEGAFGSRGYGTALHAGWHAVDEHPRDDKGGLVELGASCYF